MVAYLTLNGEVLSATNNRRLYHNNCGTQQLKKKSATINDRNTIGNARDNAIPTPKCTIAVKILVTRNQNVVSICFPSPGNRIATRSNDCTGGSTATSTVHAATAGTRRLQRLWRIQDFCKGGWQLVPLECPKPLHALPLSLRPFPPLLTPLTLSSSLPSLISSLPSLHSYGRSASLTPGYDPWNFFGNRICK